MDWRLIFVLIAFAIYLVYNAFALGCFGVPKSLRVNTFIAFLTKTVKSSYIYGLETVALLFCLVTDIY